jgi:hypothetical protein
MLFYAKGRIFRLCQVRTNCTRLYDDDAIPFVPDQHPYLDIYILKQPSAGRHVAPFGNIIPIPNQPVFSLIP